MVVRSSMEFAPPAIPIDLPMITLNSRRLRPVVLRSSTAPLTLLILELSLLSALRELPLIRRLIRILVKPLILLLLARIINPPLISTVMVSTAKRPLELVRISILSIALRVTSRGRITIAQFVTMVQFQMPMSLLALLSAPRMLQELE